MDIPTGPENARRLEDEDNPADARCEVHSGFCFLCGSFLELEPGTMLMMKNQRDPKRKVMLVGLCTDCLDSVIGQVVKAHPDWREHN
jgi:hypothetical protein